MWLLVQADYMELKTAPRFTMASGKRTTTVSQLRWANTVEYSFIQLHKLFRPPRVSGQVHLNARYTHNLTGGSRVPVEELMGCIF